MPYRLHIAVENLTSLLFWVSGAQLVNLQMVESNAMAIHSRLGPNTTVAWIFEVEDIWRNAIGVVDLKRSSDETEAAAGKIELRFGTRNGGIADVFYPLGPPYAVWLQALPKRERRVRLEVRRPIRLEEPREGWPRDIYLFVVRIAGPYELALDELRRRDPLTPRAVPVGAG